MQTDLLLLHIARTQYAQGIVQQQHTAALKKLLDSAKITVPPELAAALGESKVHHEALKAALAAAQSAPPK